MTTRPLAPALAALALGSLAGCTVENYGTVEVAAMCLPTATCTFAATCTNTYGTGYPGVDLLTNAAPSVGVGGSLLEVFQLDNLRVNNASSSNGLTNTNDATIEEFDMDYEVPGYTIPSFKVPTFQTVPAAGTATMFVYLIPPAAGLAMTGLIPANPTQVLISFRALGHFGDGATFETGKYQVPALVSQLGLYDFGCPTGKTLQQICPQPGQSDTILTCQ